MTQPHLRIISLIPSATEIVCALGLENFLVGRSHECDFPFAVKDLPVCTAPKFNPEGTSGEIHQRVSDLLTSALSVYRVDVGQLEALQPTHIITQAQCEVCAVSLGDVEAAVAELTASQPQLISLSPNRLADVWDDIYKTGVALLGEAGQVRAEAVLAGLKERVQVCRDRTAHLPSPTVACIEWTEPLMAAGNWVPELVALAGGTSLFGQVGQHSPWLTWDDLVAADPEVIVIMPCGYDLTVTRRESAVLAAHPQWPLLRAVQAGRVFLSDGNQYFNRPGPRLVDSLEMLAEIFHPAIAAYGYRGRGWQPFNSGLFQGSP
ncbi:cobalamin-binding protein [Leptolyngbya sp. KIOST-1]|uniref:cobalamin-binding protein n=1 Tax=Leptolyngbya sp. KIOST-1 TaxID=1229172 RepID=UPI00056582BA|nr:cobalamin-binding protein [Leptolyngbya sp. KIOST-1]